MRVFQSKNRSDLNRTDKYERKSLEALRPHLNLEYWLLARVTLILRFSVCLCVAAERGVGQDLVFQFWLALVPKLSDQFQ